MSSAQRAALECMNAYHDSRECDAVEAPVLYLEDGTEKKLPMKWAVCHVCNGKGTHVNPSIDSGGLTSEDFAEDPDFAEEYFAGTYDQTCNACKGRTTVAVVDEDRISPADLKLYREQLDDEAQLRREEYYERRAGA